MLNIFKHNQVMGVASGDTSQMLGKFLYFSLANILVNKNKLTELCQSMNIP